MLLVPMQLFERYDHGSRHRSFSADDENLAQKLDEH